MRVPAYLTEGDSALGGRGSSVVLTLATHWNSGELSQGKRPWSEKKEPV